MTKQIAVLPGDGIGPEIIHEAVQVLEALKLNITFQQALVGGAAYERHGHPLPDSTLKLAQESDAVLFGAVGDWKYDQLERSLRPEQAILGLRKSLGLFANLRPVKIFPELSHSSSLKPELVSNLDILIIRELTGDIYFGEPRGRGERADGPFSGCSEGFDTMRYAEPEVRRIARLAFKTAQQRQGRLCSVDKANVLETSQFWRDIVIEESADFPDVELTHMYIDNAAMQLVRAPKAFDVIVTGNLFGDILSDEAAMLTGSIGMLASASLNERGQGLYEPIHGSAPDIAGRNQSNPLAAIMSAAYLLRHSFNWNEPADRIENAISKVLSEGLRTADIQELGCTVVSTSEMGEAVRQAL